MATRSVSGGIFNELFYLYMAIAVVVGGLVIGWLVYILIKYRGRPEQAKPRDAPRAGVLPAERGHPLWSYVMAIVIAGIMFGLAFGTISAIHTLETPPEGEEWLHINVVGFQFGWRVEYEGVGGVLVASRVNEWTVPVDTAIVANVTSRDVWHNFALSEYRIRIDAIPGQVNHIWWKGHDVATIEPVCVQICGVGHALMKSQMHVVPQEEFDAYLANESQRAYAALERAGKVLNLTYDGAGFVASDNKTLDLASPFALRVDNQGPETETFTLGRNTITLAAGETGLVASSEGATRLEARGSGATHALGGSS